MEARSAQMGKQGGATAERLAPEKSLNVLTSSLTGHHLLEVARDRLNIYADASFIGCSSVTEAEASVPKCNDVCFCFAGCHSKEFDLAG